MRLKAIFLAAALILTLTACGAKRPAALIAETEATLKTVQMLPAERIPESGWTEESFSYTVRLGGYQKMFPLTLAECGSLFSVDTEKGLTYDGGKATGRLLVEGCYVGTVSLTDCPSETDLRGGRVRSMTFTAPKAGDGNDYPSLYPVALNKVTIGSSAEDIRQNLGYDVTAAGTIDISEKIGRYQFTIKGDAANGVTAITLTDAGT